MRSCTVFSLTGTIDDGPIEAEVEPLYVKVKLSTSCFKATAYFSNSSLPIHSGSNDKLIEKDFSLENSSSGI